MASILAITFILFALAPSALSFNCLAIDIALLLLVLFVILFSFYLS